MKNGTAFSENKTARLIDGETSRRITSPRLYFERAGGLYPQQFFGGKLAKSLAEEIATDEEMKKMTKKIDYNNKENIKNAAA
ncbi:MAG: hypothetical protein SOT81_03400 [Treponema sp.]|nr:hypothetical protein [Treponema sp.]